MRRGIDITENMAGEKPICVEGTVIELLPNSMFRVQLSNGHMVLAHLSGKMKVQSFQIVSGEKVMIEMSPYDLSNGRINHRLKTTTSQP